MIERLLILAGLIIALAAGLMLYRRWQVHRVARLATGDPVLANWLPGVPTVVYFSASTCAPCRLQQEPALRALQAELGARVRVVPVDALAQPEAARRWGVLTVPTTFVLDRRGQPQEVNYGVASAEKLKQQLLRVG